MAASFTQNHSVFSILSCLLVATTTFSFRIQQHQNPLPMAITTSRRQSILFRETFARKTRSNSSLRKATSSDEIAADGAGKDEAEAKVSPQRPGRKTASQRKSSSVEEIQPTSERKQLKRGRKTLQKSKKSSATSIDPTVVEPLLAAASRTRFKEGELDYDQYVGTKEKKQQNRRARKGKNDDSDRRWRNELLNHKTLNRDQEFLLGRKIRMMKAMQETLTQLVEAKLIVKQQEEEARRLNSNYYDYDDESDCTISDEMLLAPAYGGYNDDDDEAGEDYSNMFGFSVVDDPFKGLDQDDERYGPLLSYYDGSGRLIKATQPENDDDYDSPSSTDFDLRVQSWDQRGNRYQLSSASAFSSSKPVTSSSLPSDASYLTDEEIQDAFQMDRSQLQRTLLEGAMARDDLIRHNVKLVVSIAKTWAKRSLIFSDDTVRSGAKRSKNGKNLDGTSSTIRSNMDSATVDANLYKESEQRPSLDEAIQEGIMGLAHAAEIYDPSRGLRFSTMAYYWVESYVRTCYQRRVTGCLKVSLDYYNIKSRYRVVMKEIYLSGEENPGFSEVARRCKVTERRLRNALKYTKPLISLDAPVGSSLSAMGGGVSNGIAGVGKAGAAGADLGSSSGVVSLSDTIESKDCADPLEYVEMSFLRQCLENALAMELSPHERDIVRLRLGLDDGVSRTAKEVQKVMNGGSGGGSDDGDDDVLSAITVGEIRKTEKRAYAKLRAPYSIHYNQLKAYLEMNFM